MIEKGFQSLERKVESAKRSVLYDLNKKMEELKNEIKISNDPQLLESLQERDVLPPLPIKNLADFQDFEQQIQIPEISAALVSPFNLKLVSSKT